MSAFQDMGVRTADRHGNIPVHGAVTSFARDNGLSRPTVLAGLRSGTLRVGDAGTIEPARATIEPLPSKPHRHKLPSLHGRGRIKDLPVKPAYGALRRARQKYGLGVQQAYRLIREGRLFVDEKSREFRFNTEVSAAAAEPNATSDLTTQRAEIRHLLKTYVANAMAAGEPPAHAVYGLVSDLRALAHDAGWSTP